MTAVDLDELQGAIVWVSATFVDNRAFICRRTGTIYWVSDEIGLCEAETETPDDVEDLGKYLPVPTKHELDIGNRLAFEFVAANVPEQYDQVRNIFRRKGAYGAFKTLLEQSNLLEAWYDFSEKQSLRAIRDWCQSENLEIAEDLD